MLDEKLCFVIAPIGEDDSDIRKRSDQIFKHIIDPIATKHGYKAIRADHVEKLGSITTDLVEHLLKDPLVIADLTDHNPNVMYELAIRHAVRKPVVQLIQKGEKLPFDVAQQRTISVDHKDLDSVEAARERLSRQIGLVEKDPTEVDSPVSIALDTSILKTSAKPVESILVEILSLLQEVRADQNRRIVSEEIAEMLISSSADCVKDLQCEPPLSGESRSAVMRFYEDKMRKRNRELVARALFQRSYKPEVDESEGSS